MNAARICLAFFCPLVAAAALQAGDVPFPPGRDSSREVVEAGRQLFTMNFARPERTNLGQGGNGLGPLFNAASCGSCHSQGGAGGGGDLDHNVQMVGIVTSPMPRGSVAEILQSARKVHPGLTDDAPLKIFHKFVIGAPENIAAYDAWRDGVLKDFGIDTVSSVKPVRKRVDNVTMEIAQRNTPALWGMGLIDRLHQSGGNTFRRRLLAEQTERYPWITGRAPRTPDGADGWYGWRGQIADLNDMVLSACSTEVGLQTPGFPEAQLPIPGTKPVAGKRDATPETDLTRGQTESLIAFVHNLPRPVRVPVRSERVSAGERIFDRIGCSHCHVQNLSWVPDIFSDMSLHDMGYEMKDVQSAGPDIQIRDVQVPVRQGYGGAVPLTTVQRLVVEPHARDQEWKTAPLWGVADSAPYWHDGRAATLKEAILLHGGEAERSTNAFQQLDSEDQDSLLAFLGSLKAPPEQQASVTAKP